MAIYTRMGSKVDPIGGPDAQGWIKVRRESDNAVREFHISELKRDTDEESLFLNGQTSVSGSDNESAK